MFNSNMSITHSRSGTIKQTTECNAEQAPMGVSKNEVYIHVQAQIAAKAQRAAAEQDQRREEAQSNAAAEAAYQAKVNATLTTAAPKQYFGRRKVDWYS